MGAMATLPAPVHELAGKTGTRLPGAFVLRDVPPEQAAAPIDWTAWYLTDEEDMGESAEQSLIIETLLSSIGTLATERRWENVLWLGDQFFAWVEQQPLVRVSPDVYLLDDPPNRPLPRSWQTWKPGHKPPRLAIEIVSEQWSKDYDDGPPKYAQLGTDELVIFDPEVPEPPGRRVPLQVYQRQADGAFARVYVGPGPALSKQLDAYLVVSDIGGAPQLRLARDADGVDVIPTAKERAEAAEQRVRELEEELRRSRQS